MSNETETTREVVEAPRHVWIDPTSNEITDYGTFDGVGVGTEGHLHYVRADLHDAAVARAETAEAEVARLKEALEGAEARGRQKGLKEAVRCVPQLPHQDEYSPYQQGMITSGYETMRAIAALRALAPAPTDGGRQ